MKYLDQYFNKLLWLGGVCMSGIAEHVVKAIFQISCEFSCDIGNPKKTILGTGFFIKKGDKPLFITNRHNIDPALKLGNETSYKLSKISICLRKKTVGEISLETKWFDLKNLDGVSRSLECDVSIIHKFIIDGGTDINEYQPDCFLLSELADEHYIKKISLMDVASFVGFPGDGKNIWWDTDGNFPISRTVNIASFPGKSYKNKSIITNEVVLVSGLSFFGSSGSPLFLHEKGLQINGTPGEIEIMNDSYLPPKIIGIMSGHWWDPASIPNMFQHSGLSYYTKSTVIHDLIKTLRF